MAVFESRFFGDVVVEKGAFVRRETSLGSRVLTRSLFVGDEFGADQALLDRAASLVDTMETLDQRAREAIDAEGDDVPGYVTFHLEELEDDVLRRIFGADRAAIDRAAFLAKLDLVGVAVHVREPAGFSLVLDYSLGPSVSDQLLAVTFDMEGRATRVSHES